MIMSHVTYELTSYCYSYNLKVKVDWVGLKNLDVGNTGQQCGGQKNKMCLFELLLIFR